MGRPGRIVGNAGEYSVQAWEEQRLDGSYYEARFIVSGPDASDASFSDLGSAIALAERLNNTPKKRPSGLRMG